MDTARRGNYESGSDYVLEYGELRFTFNERDFTERVEQAARSQLKRSTRTALKDATARLAENRDRLERAADELGALARVGHDLPAAGHRPVLRAAHGQRDPVLKVPDRSAPHGQARVGERERSGSAFRRRTDPADRPCGPMPGGRSMPLSSVTSSCRFFAPST